MPNVYTKINTTRVYCNEELYEETAEELDISISLVKEIVHANSQFIRRVIETGGFENVILPYLGKVKSKPRSVQKAAAAVNRSGKK